MSPAHRRGPRSAGPAEAAPPAAARWRRWSRRLGAGVVALAGVGAMGASGATVPTAQRPPAVAPARPGPSPPASGGVPGSVAGFDVRRLDGYWWADYTDVVIGPAGCTSNSGTATATTLRPQWDYWDTCGASVVSAADEALPATPWGGDHVVKWRKGAGDDNYLQKLNKTFTRGNWPSGSFPAASDGSPADVSARYIVFQYVPRDRFRLNPSHGWVILSQFKENYRDADGTFRQDPTWGVGCNNFDGLRCGLTPGAAPTFPISDIVDRWVKWEYRLYQGARDRTGRGGRIELYVDDILKATGYESERHVGPGTFAPSERTESWVWIAGQYTSNQVTNGVPDWRDTDVTSYVGLSTVLPLP